ncbi:MAG: glycosyltransferase family 4 protein [Immundisolibacteraceae bacterium]|nr:glycosyltransferase family 4 protein [Immundisolibacteraceae bacterium]
MDKTKRRLLVIAKDSDGSSTRYRAGQFVSGIEQGGWQIDILAVGRGGARRRQMLAAAAKADVVLVLRKTFGPLTTWVLRKVARRLIFDFDDAIFLASNGEPSSMRYRRFARIVKASDQVWAGNSFLAEMAGGINHGTYLMPTVVDEAKYLAAGHKRSDAGTIDLVWIGSRSTGKYLETLRPVLNELAELCSDFRLKIVADFELSDLKMPQLRVDWSEQIEVVALATAQIAIAPMIDNPWTRGKCGLKVLQYMAAGLPVVTDAAGVNQHMVADRDTGFIVLGHEKWCSAILELAANPDLRLRMGGRGRERLLNKNFTLNHQTERMAKLLGKV